MHERTTRIIVAGLSRFMDELPVVILGTIAILIILQGNQGLIEKIVLAIVTGFLGYMKGKDSGRSPTPPSPPPPPPPAAE